MALTPNTIPSQVPFFATPYDAMNAFASAQTLTASGVVNNKNAVLDLGGANPSSGAGRTNGMWVMDITAIDFTSADETYRAFLLGSNDVAFGNGNVENLACHDFAAASAGRLIPTVMGASPAIPPTGASGTILQIPFTNLMQRIVYRYAQMQLIIGGTTPTITLSSWLSFAGADF